MSNYISVLSRSFAQALCLAGVIALALGINYLSAWTGPTALPPNSNVAAPLNVGTTNQVKDGNLSVGAGANTNTTIGLSTYGAHVVKGWQTIGAVTAPTQLLELKGTAGTDGIKFPDGSVQTAAASASRAFQCASGGYAFSGISLFTCVKIATGGTCTANNTNSNDWPSAAWTCASHAGWGLSGSNPANVYCTVPADSNGPIMSCIDVSTKVNCVWYDATGAGGSWACKAMTGANFAGI